MKRRGPAVAGLFRFSTGSSLLPQTQPRNFAGALFVFAAAPDPAPRLARDAIAGGAKAKPEILGDGPPRVLHQRASGERRRADMRCTAMQGRARHSFIAHTLCKFGTLAAARGMERHLWMQ